MSNKKKGNQLTSVKTTNASVSVRQQVRIKLHGATECGTSLIDGN